MTHNRTEEARLTGMERAFIEAHFHGLADELGAEFVGEVIPTDLYVEIERIIAERVAQAKAEAFADGADLIGGKVVRLSQANAVLARANGRAEERRWLDLIYALESDLARFRPAAPSEGSES